MEGPSDNVTHESAQRLAVITPAQIPKVAEPEGARRLLPWFWGRHRFRSSKEMLGLLSVWVASLLLAVGFKLLAGNPFIAQIPWLSEIFLRAPWTIAVLWFYFGRIEYGMLLCILCALIAPEIQVRSQWVFHVLSLGAFAAVISGVPAPSLSASWKNTRHSRLHAWGVFLLASFCSTSIFALIAFVTRMSALALPLWDARFFGRLFQDIVITGPLLLLLGDRIEALKLRVFGTLPVARPHAQGRWLAFGAGVTALVAFCICWTLAAEVPVSGTIERWVQNPEGLSELENIHRAAALRNAILLAVLLGVVCGGAALVALLFQRYQEQLRAEVNRGTEALRRRHSQLAILQQVAESASRSLDPDAVYLEMAESIARVTDAAQVTIYIPDEQEGVVLRLVQQVCVRPETFHHRQRLPVDSSLAGQVYRTSSVVAIDDNLPLYSDGTRERAELEANNLQSFLGVPIAGTRSTLGVVCMYFAGKYAPDEEEQRLFRLVGRALGAALERADTHVQARRYANNLGGLYRFSQQLAGESEERRMLEIAAEAARQLSGARSASFFIVAPNPRIIKKGAESSCLICGAFNGSNANAASAREAPLPLEQPGLITAALREGRTVYAGLKTSNRPPVILARQWVESVAVVVPLPPGAIDAGPAGVLVLAFDAGQPLGLEESGMAEEIARQTGAGLRRARLIEKTRQQAAELKLLEQIGRAMSQRMTINSTLDQLVQNVNRVVAAKWASVFVNDPANNLIKMRATTFTQSGAKDLAIPVASQSLVANCFRSGQTMLSPDMFSDPRCNQELNRRFETRSGLCAPLGPPGQRFGVLMINNPEPGTFGADDVRRLEQLAQLASAAIERAILYEEACQRADELILLNEAGHLLVENPELENTLQRISELVSRGFHISGAAFLLVNEKHDAFIVRGAAGENAGNLNRTRIPLDAASAQILRHLLPTVIEDANTVSRPKSFFDLLPNACSGVIVPMAGATEPLGVFVVWKNSPNQFAPRDLQCLSSVARLAAAATGRDALDRALRASQERLQEVVDGLQAMVISIDTEGKILSFNAAAERISGLSRNEIMGKSLAAIANSKPAEREKLENAIGSAFAARDTSQTLILNWETPKGERKIRWSGSFIHGSDGTPSGMVCLGIDITEQMMLEAQLLQAQKMESVGALAGGMAHDFNNLLGGIMGQCALARSQLPKGDAAVNYLVKIDSAAQRGADLTSKLMAFARKSVLQPREVDIGAIIRETTELLSGSIPRNIEITSRIVDALPRVYGDPTQLQQVILNLCVNARDAMPAGGALLLAVAPEKKIDEKGIFTDVLRIEVSDTGTGMSEEVQRHLFEPFFTTKAPGKGTGLGLSVVFGIVRSHGGTITVQSEAGKGTRFVIRLPSASAVRRQSLETPAPASLSSVRKKVETNVLSASTSGLQRAIEFKGSERIVLVDDDAMLRDTVTQLLANLGYQVRAASNGTDLLQVLDREFAPPAEQPAVLLMDVVMPGLAGLALFTEVRKRLADVPVLLISGYSADKTVQDLIAAGASELIQKPFALDTLVRSIRNAIGAQKAL